MNLKIAIISDLHCRDSQEKTKTTYLYSDLLKNPITRHPIESIKKKIIDDSLGCDYLLCLGDITDKINQQGMISGWSYINEIAVSLKVNQDNIISVIGNHDVDSRNNHNHSTFNHIVKSLNNVIPINDRIFCDQFWERNYIIKEYDDIIVLAYNSVYNHTDERRALITDINITTLEDLQSDLQKIKHIEKPRIAICHHHPIKFSNFDIEYKDGDSIDNGEKLLDLLSENDFSLFIHGHKHVPHLEYRNDLPIFCSGSFSSLENITALSIRNTFHIIELFTDNQEKCRGLIDTYEFVLGIGWKKSTDSEGFFPSKTGFGFYGDILELSTKITDWFSTQGKDMIIFSEVLKIFDELSFLTPLQQKKLEDSLLNAGNIKILPSLRATPEYIIKQIRR